MKKSLYKILKKLIIVGLDKQETFHIYKYHKSDLKQTLFKQKLLLKIIISYIDRNSLFQYNITYSKTLHRPKLPTIIFLITKLTASLHNIPCKNHPRSNTLKIPLSKKGLIKHFSVYQTFPYPLSL